MKRERTQQRQQACGVPALSAPDIIYQGARQRPTRIARARLWFVSTLGFAAVDAVNQGPFLLHALSETQHRQRDSTFSPNDTVSRVRSTNGCRLATFRLAASRGSGSPDA